MMAHSLLPLPTASPSPNSAPSSVEKKNVMLIPAAPCNKASSRFQFRRYLMCIVAWWPQNLANISLVLNVNLWLWSREVVYGLFAAGLASSLTVERANAAARRPSPPPPPEEKKDPSITGLRAKVLASKKRKEAMKEEIALLREKGKPVNWLTVSQTSNFFCFLGSSSYKLCNMFSHLVSSLFDFSQRKQDNVYRLVSLLVISGVVQISQIISGHEVI